VRERVRTVRTNDQACFTDKGRGRANEGDWKNCDQSLKIIREEDRISKRESQSVRTESKDKKFQKKRRGTRLQKDQWRDRTNWETYDMQSVKSPGVKKDTDVIQEL